MNWPASNTALAENLAAQAYNEYARLVLAYCVVREADFPRGKLRQ
jgi:hypothetical protein